jgi:hypothetical protein
MARDWGNNAAKARDDVAELCHRNVRLVRPFIQDPGLAKRRPDLVQAVMAQVFDNDVRGRSLMVQWGAPIIEDEL